MRITRIPVNRFSARAATALLVLAAVPASAAWTVTTQGAPSGCTHVISDGNWTIGVYRYSDDNWNLCKYTGANGNAYVSGEGDLDLRAVEAECGVVLKASNNGALENNTKITSVIFPDSFAVMHGNTFKNDTKLTNVVLGAGMKTIGAESFRNCSGLKSVNFPAGLETIGGYAFNGCSALELTDFTFPESLTHIGNHTFTGCKKFIGTITFPGLTTVDENYTFEDCIAMTAFVAPKCLNTVQGMFNRCSALASVMFSPDIETLAASSFENSPTLRAFSPTVMPKLSSFGQKAFRGQRSLFGDFDLSESSITELPYYAFVDCEKIGTVKLSESLTTLGSGCLAYNKKPRVVWFCGPPPTTIGSDAFNPNNTSKWVLVAGKKHAAEWKADERVDPSLTDAEKATAMTAIRTLGVSHVKPIGKWSTQSGSAVHWVVEELPVETMVLMK